MLPERIDGFYLDLRQDDVKSALALVHSRFSTNTFPTWDRAHPYRHIAHNGEINTLRGNQNWMAAREPLLASRRSASTSRTSSRSSAPKGATRRSLDNVVDFLVAGGRSLPHVMMMLVPEAWATQDDMPPEKRALLRVPREPRRAVGRPRGPRVHRRHAHRRDARPQRPAPGEVRRHRRGARRPGERARRARLRPPRTSCRKGACSPARCSSSIRPRGASSPTTRIKREIATRQAVRAVDRGEQDRARAAPHGRRRSSRSRGDERERLQRAFGYSREDLRMLLAAMAANGEEPTGSMGNDAALAVLSDRPTPLPLLQAAVRAGDEPADRSDPRRARDVARHRASAAKGTCSTRRRGSAGCSSCRTRSSRTRGSRSSSPATSKTSAAARSRSRSP